MADLERYLVAQSSDFDKAFLELSSGKKRSHWMWYIFPQIYGLGHSQTTIFFAVKNLQEAKDYLAHPILGERLKKITRILILLNTSDAIEIFGVIDALKLKSCITLFSLVDDSPERLFTFVLDKYFDGQMDSKTIELAKESK
jgi:uncharacterized protein (DUF1810 family)